MPIPVDLATLLIEYGNCDLAESQYQQRYYGKATQGWLTFLKCLCCSYQPIHPESLIRTLKLRVSQRRYLDFHSLRVCFVTMIINEGANAKEAQELARHSSSDRTMKEYAKTRTEQFAAK